MSDKKNKQKQDLANTISGSAFSSSFTPPKTKTNVVFGIGDAPAEQSQEESLAKAMDNGPLSAALKQAVGSAGNAKKNAPALAFTESPTPNQNYLGLFKAKSRLLPDEILKQIRVSDHLVAAILRARSNMLSLFGHLRKDRFDIGIEVGIKPEIYKVLQPEQLEKIKQRMKRFEALLLNCGHTEGLEHQDQLTLAEWMSIQTSNGLTFGRFATEIIYDRTKPADAEGNYPFNRFRPVDAATILRAVRKGELIGNNIRETALAMLESMTGDKPNIDMAKLREQEYAWIQVIDGTPRQAFTHDEMLVFNLFTSTDVEHNGYPVTPLDTVVSSVTTHISIDAYKKMYFQNGRASKGMLVIQSDEVDEAILNSIKQQFNASINSVSNSFRTPIFGMGKDDTVQWLPTDQGLQDDNFQFMYDQVARNILSAFSISPDELPGYSHLSRGTNSQTLSESNNEFKLTAARDTGLRPLILKFQTFFNQRLFPIMDPLLSKICEIKLVGLDAQSKEQESTRLQQDSALHMDYDGLLEEVDKDPVGAFMGGKLPFNERWQLIADKYLDVAEIRGRMMDDPSAFVDPMLRYKRDPFYLQYLQLMAEINPAAVKALFVAKPYAMDFLKLELEDSLEDDDSID